MRILFQGEVVPKNYHFIGYKCMTLGHNFITHAK